MKNIIKEVKMAALGGLGNFTSMANMSSMPPNMSMSNSNMMGTNNKPGLGMCFYELNPFFSTHLALGFHFRSDNLRKFFTAEAKFRFCLV